MPPIPHARPQAPLFNRRDLLTHTTTAWAAATAGPLTAALALGGCEATGPRPSAAKSATPLAVSRSPSIKAPDNATSQVNQGVLGSQPFALGVASGSARDTSVVLWTRLVAPDGDAAAWPPITVRWELAHDPGFAQLVRTGTVQAEAAWAHSVHVVVSGLEPDRVYFYRFRAGEAVSAVGRTRTTPAPGAAAARWRLALASCQRWEHGLYAAWRHMQADAPDAVVFVGDYIYEYASAPTALRRVPGGAALSLADYRARYAAYKSDPHLQAMHAGAPWWITWDDHEVENDYAGAQGGNAGRDSAAFMARRRAAYQAFYEHMPLRPEVLTQGLAGLGAGAELRLYGHVDLGALARLVLLDTRQYRHAQVCNRLNAWGSSTLDPTRCAAWFDPQRSLLGRSQEAWLAQTLRDGASQGQPWLVVAQTTLMGELNHSAKPQQRLWNDAWDGYAAARLRLTQHLAGLRGSHPGSVPLVLGGDVHESWVGRVLADYARPDSSAVGVELCGTSISSHSSHTAEQMAQRLANNPHFDWADTLHRGYTLLDLTPQGATALIRGLDDVRKAQTPVSTLARFVVEPGRAAVHRAG